MNKKGFMFVETIVMCAVLMVALLIIYNSYVSVIAREKELLNYNNVDAQYKLIYYIQSLGELNTSWLCNDVSKCTAPSAELAGNDYINLTYKEDVLKTFGIEQVYLTKCDKVSSGISISMGSPEFKSYMSKPKKCKEETSYVYVGEIKDNKTRMVYYAWTEYPRPD